MNTIVTRRLGDYCKLLAISWALSLTVSAAEDTTPPTPPTPIAPITTITTPVQIKPVAPTRVTVTTHTDAKAETVKDVKGKKRSLIQPVQPNEAEATADENNDTDEETPAPEPKPKPVIEFDTEDEFGNERPTKLNVGNEKLIIPPNAVNTRAIKAKEDAALKAEIAASFRDAKREYNLHHYEKAIVQLRAILAIDPRHLPAVNLLTRAQTHITDADETIAANATAQSLRDANLESDEHIIRPPVRQPTVRPRLAKRSDSTDFARRAKMSEYLKEELTFDFMDADLEFVLEKLFQLTGANIIADPEAMKDKKISMHVSNLPLKSVLEYIVRNNDGIHYSVTEDAIWITASKDTDLKKLMYPKVYPLQHGLLSTVASTNAGTGQAIAPGGAGGAAPAPAPAAGGGATPEEPDYLQTFLKWLQEIKDVQAFPDGSKYHVDKQSNNLIVYTTPAGHQKIEEFLDVFDQPPIQVLIKTRFLEISSTKDSAIGLNLDSMTSKNTAATTQDANGNTVSTGKNPFFLGDLVGGATSFVTSGTPGGTLLTITGRRTDPLFKTTLSLLMTDRNTSVLSEPQVLAVNNKTADVKITQHFSYISDYRIVQLSDSVDNNGVRTPRQTFVPIFKEKDVGYTLNVTPSIGRDLKTITLHLNPVIDSFAEGQSIADFQVLEVGGVNSTTPPPVKEPTTNQTSLETDVVVEDNGYVILGGLISNFQETQTRKIPGLNRIPYLGKFFQSKNKSAVRRNLMIIVEAQIVSPAGRNYYKAKEADDGDIRQGGFTKSPGQTSDHHDVPPFDPIVPKAKNQKIDPVAPVDSITPVRAVELTPMDIPIAEPVELPSEELKKPKKPTELEIPAEKPAEKKSSLPRKSTPLPKSNVANAESDRDDSDPSEQGDFMAVTPKADAEKSETVDLRKPTPRPRTHPTTVATLPNTPKRSTPTAVAAKKSSISGTFTGKNESNSDSMTLKKLEQLAEAARQGTLDERFIYTPRSRQSHSGTVTEEEKDSIPCNTGNPGE